MNVFRGKGRRAQGESRQAAPFWGADSVRGEGLLNSHVTRVARHAAERLIWVGC
jgi:hypothetical protein